MEPIGTLIPSQFIPEGRGLSRGELTVTLTSRATLNHVTMRLRCTVDGENTVAFHDAQYVLIEGLDGLRLATYYPMSGDIAFNSRIDSATRWSVKAMLRWCANEFPTLPLQALIDSEDYALV